MGELEGQHGHSRLDHAPMGMEPISSMTARAQAWWREAVIPWVKAQSAAQLGNSHEREGPRDVLIVSHGGLIRVLLQALCGETVRVEKGVKLTKCMNASVTVIEIDAASGKGRITRFSDVSHLRGSVVKDNVDEEDTPPRVYEDTDGKGVYLAERSAKSSSE